MMKTKRQEQPNVMKSYLEFTDTVEVLLRVTFYVMDVTCLTATRWLTG